MLLRFLAIEALCAGCGTTRDMGDAADSSVDVAEATPNADDAADAADTEAPAACNDLVNAAKMVQGQHSIAPPPPIMGGNIVSGLYYLTAITDYDGMTGPSNAAGKLTVRITLGLDEVYESGGEKRDSNSIQVNNALLKVTQTCPGASSVTFGFNASQTELRLYEPVGNVTRESVLTKQ